MGRRHKSNEYNLEDFEYGVGYTSNGDSFLFDKEDYPLISQYRWHRHQDGYMRTCVETIKEGNKYHNIYIMMHQLIRNTYYPDSDKIIDHINGNPADNRKENLRLLTQRENMKNMKCYSNNTSGHTGVFWTKLEKKWKARITVDGRVIHLGTFTTYEEAVKVREQAEEQYYCDLRRKEHIS